MADSVYHNTKKDGHSSTLPGKSSHGNHTVVLVICDLLSENLPFSQISILPLNCIEIHWVEIHKLHEKFYTRFNYVVHTEIKFKSIKPIYQ